MKASTKISVKNRVASSRNLAFAAAVVTSATFTSGCAMQSYPENLQKYVQVIEQTSSQGFADFRKDVSSEVCAFYSQDDFPIGTTKFTDTEVKTIYNGDMKRVQIMVTRQLEFKRAMIIEAGQDRCSAFVESYFL